MIEAIVRIKEKFTLPPERRERHRLARKAYREERVASEKRAKRDTVENANAMFQTLPILLQNLSSEIDQLTVAKIYRHEGRHHHKLYVGSTLEANGLIFDGSGDTLSLFLQLITGESPKNRLGHYLNDEKNLPSQILGWNIKRELAPHDRRCKQQVVCYELIRNV